MVWGLNPIVGTRFLHNSRLALGPILCLTQGVQCLFSGGKVARAEPSWPVVGWNFWNHGSMLYIASRWSRDRILVERKGFLSPKD
jgi:hypothetical protein